MNRYYAIKFDGKNGAELYRMSVPPYGPALFRTESAAMRGGPTRPAPDLNPRAAPVALVELTPELLEALNELISIRELMRASGDPEGWKRIGILCAALKGVPDERDAMLASIGGSDD